MILSDLDSMLVYRLRYMVWVILHKARIVGSCEISSILPHK
jgi:hypothetical protein